MCGVLADGLALQLGWFPFRHCLDELHGGSIKGWMNFETVGNMYFDMILG